MADIQQEIAALAAQLLKEFAQRGIADAQTFLAEAQADLISLEQDHQTGAITEAEYQNGLRTTRALAKMEKIKQAGLAQVTIDQFTSGVIGIVTRAALTAI